MALKAKNYSDKQIGEMVGLARETVTRKIASYKEMKSKANDFAARRVDALVNVQRLCIDSITLDEIKSLKVPQRIWVMGVLYDKERLEKGKSTANIAINISSLTDSDKELLANMAGAYARKAAESVRDEDRYDG
jgi:hypothetical protein